MKEKINETEYLKYAKNYSEGDFFIKIRKYAKNIGLTPITYAMAIYYLLKNNKVSQFEKIKIVGALGYLISPIDLIPDILLGTGYIDDAGMLYLVYKSVKNNINYEIAYNVYSKLNEWFSVKIEEVIKILDIR